MCDSEASQAVETFALARVGTFKTPFTTAFGCPRQGLAAPSVRGCIELAPWVAAASAGSCGSFLRGLDGFSHVWVIFMFDQNRHSSASFDPGKSFLKASVKPPWLTDAEGRRGSHGVFATRSPHRPNPIGLTVCRLDAIDEASGRVFVSGVDVVDGSAVLDIKPYHPIDSVPPASGMPALADDAMATASCAGAAATKEGAGVPTSASDVADVATAPDHSTDSLCTTSHVSSTCGTLATCVAGAAATCAAAVGARFPPWLPAPRAVASVRWSTAALEQLENLQSHCTFYPDARDSHASGCPCPDAVSSHVLRRAVEDVLGLDPRTPQSRGRGARREETTHQFWAFDFDVLSIAFRLLGDPNHKDTGPTFEVVRVDLRGSQGARSSKAWLESLRQDLAESPIEQHDT